MKKIRFQFSRASTDFYFAASFSMLKDITARNNTILLTDQQLHAFHHKKFNGWKTIVIPSGEEHKNQATADHIIEQLIALEADRQTVLVGIGGGVITDMTGYVASVYMRGIRFGFIPTTLLGLVDASIGGKNGIDVGLYKNMVGVINQPTFILHDMAFLKTLPQMQWSNGFAEIIKHACIKDASMFKELEKTPLKKYQSSKTLLAELIRRNATLKSKIVQRDEFETAERRLLNFGHTLGHAVENMYQLPHGFAVSIGMVAAAKISAEYTGFRDTDRLIHCLENYELPVSTDFDIEKAFEILKMDKKKSGSALIYIVLEKIGKAAPMSISLPELQEQLLMLQTNENEGYHIPVVR